MSTLLRSITNPELTQYELSQSLDGVAENLVAALVTIGPPFDALVLARSLGLQGVVLQTVDVANQFIARATTDTGLRVVAEAVQRVYQTGLQASAEFIQNRPIGFHHSLTRTQLHSPLVTVSTNQ
jgi:hypothetical protein